MWASQAIVDGNTLTPSTLREGGGEGSLHRRPEEDPHPRPLPEYREREKSSSLSNGLAYRARRSRRIRRIIVLLILFASIAPFIIFRAAVRFWPYPKDISDLPPASTLLLDRNGTPLVALISREENWHTPLTESGISPNLMHAIVAVEDERFYAHDGVDWKSMLGAAWEDFRYLSIRRGASTIAMQLERLRDPRPRSFWNKFEQAVRAEQLERRSSKQHILVEYINRASFGGNLVGAEAASVRYFGHSCRELSLGEAALLAALPQSPNRLRPDRYPHRAGTRRNHVLDRMLACGFITQHARDEAAAEPLGASWRELPQNRPAGGLPADGALPALAGQFGGRTVSTTLDAATQRTACRIATETLEPLHESGVNAAAIVVLDTTSSQCLALVSAATGERAESVDLTRAERSTGSVLKPFIYAAAFDDGICTPKTILDDSPAAWPGYMPSDYDRQFRGEISAADALAESRNIPAMVLLSRVGVDRASSMMDAAGLTGLCVTPDRYGLSLAIGGADESPLQVATAYAALARGDLRRCVVGAGGNPALRASAKRENASLYSGKRMLGSAGRPERPGPHGAHLPRGRSDQCCVENGYEQRPSRCLVCRCHAPIYRRRLGRKCQRAGFTGPDRIGSGRARGAATDRAARRRAKRKLAASRTTR